MGRIKSLGGREGGKEARGRPTLSADHLGGDTKTRQPKGPLLSPALLLGLSLAPRGWELAGQEAGAGEARGVANSGKGVEHHLEFRYPWRQGMWVASGRNGRPISQGQYPELTKGRAAGHLPQALKAWDAKTAPHTGL